VEAGAGVKNIRTWELAHNGLVVLTTAKSVKTYTIGRGYFGFFPIFLKSLE